jgi:cyclopropane fatty-acyl-phospholipid synthase-like methyltransferase
LFFASGEDYVERIWKEIELGRGEAFSPRRSLDFGCGVGRIAVPIARRSAEMVGVDIADSMLAEASRNSQAFGVNNISFVKGDNDISLVTGEFDLVHSFIVFQHIKPAIGMRIIKRLVALLSSGGEGMIHVQYANSKATTAERLRFTAYRDLPLVYAVRNAVLRKHQEPLIPMYSYDLNKIMLILQKAGCGNVRLRFSHHGVEGVLIFFSKRAESTY